MVRSGELVNGKYLILIDQNKKQAITKVKEAIKQVKYKSIIN